MIILLFILSIIILLVLYYILYYKKIKENFADSEEYLYPVIGLTDICMKYKLYPSYMPKACYENNTLNSYANCKCEDKNGNCKICYPTIKKDSNNSNIVYNANNIS